MMDERLEEAFATVGRALSAWRGDWWIIGSGALVLAGIDAVSPEDVDVFGPHEGMLHLLEALGVRDIRSPKPGDRFRSNPYQRVRRPGLPDIEVMGGLEVNTAVGWQALAPRTRVPVRVRDATVYIPSLSEQAGIFRLFGREKDNAKARLAEASL
jgi:hypothetical protein